MTSLAQPLRPSEPTIYQDGDTAIAVFEASARLSDGSLYKNHYAWFMTFRGAHIMTVLAFLDLQAFEKTFPK